MPGPKSLPPKPENNGFIVRAVMLAALILVVGWAAWILPRSRAASVSVQTVGSQQPNAASTQTAPPSPASSTETGVASSTSTDSTRIDSGSEPGVDKANKPDLDLTADR